MTKKIAITIDESLLAEIDYLVEQKVYSSRSKAIEANLEINRNNLRRQRFEIECSKLDREKEREEAEWGGFDNWTTEEY
ncbi:ribbon-helix-helix domain-containing protein [Anaplasma marginale]|uniref:ribbon-helix-helix domain-containing protein n=1 Tax=Anaplasma marginale TaxID=770 RepID=UPI0005B38CE4|nr:ribbon-helix-helix domain-containing protein [Anaplasma marginale]